MVLATNNASLARTLLDNGIRTVTTGIVKAIVVTIPVSVQKEGKLGVGDGEVITGLLEAQLVSQENPFLREDCSAFELVNIWGAVPRRWKPTGWFCLGVSVAARRESKEFPHDEGDVLGEFR